MNHFHLLDQIRPLTEHDHDFFFFWQLHFLKSNCLVVIEYELCKPNTVIETELKKLEQPYGSCLLYSWKQIYHLF